MSRYPEDAPEVAMHSLPESYHHHSNGAHMNTHHHPQSPSTAPSETPTTVYSSYVRPDHSVIYGQEHKEVYGGNNLPARQEKRVFGLPVLVFVLAVLVGVLGIVVIGLAAGVGIATKNYNKATADLENSNMQVTDMQNQLNAARFVTSYANITNGCSDRSGEVTGTKYSTHFNDYAEYTMYCNKDAARDPIYSTFAGSFSNCMEACTTWNKYVDDKNYTSPQCSAATYIPYWSNVLMAVGNMAPGDCYLKSGPINVKNFTSSAPNLEVHIAVKA